MIDFISKMLKIRHIVLCSLVLVYSLVLTGCAREEISTITSIKSFPVGDNISIYQTGTTDLKGDYMYFAILDQITIEEKIMKVDLKTLEVVKSITIPPGHAVAFPNNLFYGEDNHLYFHEHSFITGDNVIHKYTVDLKYVSTDVVETATFNFNVRRRLCAAGTGKMLAATNFIAPSGAHGVKYELMDYKFGRIKVTQDTGVEYGPQFLLSDIKKCADGGYIMLGLIRSATGGSSILEKRDENLNLIWRSRTTNQLVHQVVESKGDYYAYGSINDQATHKHTYVLVKYDGNGNFIKELRLKSNGQESILSEAFVLTEDGGFLCPAVTSEQATPGTTKSILFRISNNLELESYQLFGGSLSTFAGSIHRAEQGVYVFLYGESSFAAEQGKPRYVLARVDKKGEIIK